jgi:hypothetical protein
MHPHALPDPRCAQPLLACSVGCGWAGQGVGARGEVGHAGEAGAVAAGRLRQTLAVRRRAAPGPAYSAPDPTGSGHALLGE